MKYESPFGTRYNTEPMASLWGEVHKRVLWRRVWAAYALARKLPEVRTLNDNIENVDLERSLEIEKITKHDLVAELRVYAEQCGIDSGKLHGELTSSDVQDNAEVMRQVTACEWIAYETREVLQRLHPLMDRYKDRVVMGRTHLQPARPTTLGYRFAVYGFQLIFRHHRVSIMANTLRGKGLKGPVGTMEGIGVDENNDTMEALNLRYMLMTGQTYDRSQDYELLSILASLAAVLSKMALDVRLMKMENILSALPSAGQVGSSAMPEKVNPILEEKVCSLARLIEANASVAWHNAASQMLERTLDDSANRRMIIPESFLATEEMLRSTVSYLERLRVSEDLPILVGSTGFASELAKEGAEVIRRDFGVV
jgi:adenylosuccinate lyase